MVSPNICIFANFFIDQEERFFRLQDSFNSLVGLNPNEWRINVRGRFKDHVRDFLMTKKLKNIKITSIESKKGWFFDSIEISKDITSELIFIWVEDHIALASPEEIMESFYEMYQLGASQIPYSMWHEGSKKFYKKLHLVIKGEYVSIYKLDKVLFKKTKDTYIVSLPSLMTKDFFLQVLKMKKPYLKRWPRKVPFDFEKNIKDFDNLDFFISFPNRELFCCIDDNHDQKSYSLIERGLYPNRISREALREIEFGKSSNFLVKLINENKGARAVKNFLRRLQYTLNI